MSLPQIGFTELREASTAEDFEQARNLFTTYAASMYVPSCFHGFDQELMQMRYIYAQPNGGLFLAYSGALAVGCCGFRALPDTNHINACEMKRLYVLPAFRGTGLGHRLVAATMDAARVSGYSCMLLDTLSEMESARALYEEVGFMEVAPFAHSPIPGAHHLKVDL